MIAIVKIENIEELILDLRGQRVLLDRDIAQIYDVATRDVNKSVANNPDKFPPGYLFELTREEKGNLVENFNRFKSLKYSPVNPKAFTEKGLYMLATILKNPQATQATLTIIETFSKLRELSRHVKELAALENKTKDKTRKKTLVQRSSELVTDILGDELKINNTETTIELNFAVLKLKHTIKKSRDEKH